MYKFLTLVDIIEIHKNQIQLYGGESGIRDYKLLSSAIAMPESTFDSKFLHNDVYEMAAAYAFHICQNHPFIDGNKRVGLVAALIFLDFNDIEIEDNNNILYKAMMNVSNGKIGKKELSKIFKELSI